MRGERGQATVELVAVLPLVALLALLAWQAVVAGHVVWVSGSAARAAARASALGADAQAAARRVLPAARVRDDGDGAVTLTAPIPAVVAGVRLAEVRTQARFAPQDG
ncbi:MAG TPA: hypothetical protein VFR97_07005 [Capillimicrobium sp.]|nr:hypothetical protein [Capillimicrobium sp.]